MVPDESDNPLGNFLRARRNAVLPAEVGLPTGGHRRSPGLRREELASLAGVSLPYYVRLEQGRDRRPSRDVLAALGRVLCLDEENLLYLARLAGLTPQYAQGRPEPVRPELDVLVSRSPGPAILVSRYRDVLAANELARALHPAFARGENLLRFLFCDPRADALVVNWREIVETAMGRLRLDTATEPRDDRLRELVQELTAASEAFGRLWRSHPTPVPIDRDLHLNHPRHGRLQVRFERLIVASSPGQMLYLANGPILDGSWLTGEPTANGSSAAR